MELEGRVAIVTGASSGIGRATALACAASGMRVLGVARRAELLASLAAESQARVVGMQADVSDVERAPAIVARTLDAFGRVDVLVNCAGQHITGPIAGLNADAFAQTLRTNVLGPVALIRAALPEMYRQNAGTILNVSSLQGDRAMPFQGAYGASKHALNAVTDALRMELAGTSIRVVTFVPDPTATGFATSGGAGETASRPASMGVRMPRLRASTAEAQAHRILETIRQERTGFVYASWVGLGLARAAAWAPGLADWVYARRVRRSRDRS